ncbi:hypothetical protein RA280_38890 [Cupriavidus sp. CV2]|uniref:hypothetical protein n=1 Tax=Cupriavidus ulmosensis TaxID=3065913 RepID=UPI00296ADCFD|nr:hypothetical protein [Cupriavidus sp. CV2]MDW3687600.1 hypothetical protein [Cupriavidus sp. CV2]
MTKKNHELTAETLAVRVQSLAEQQMEEHYAREKEREASERERLENLCTQREDVDTYITDQPKPMYSATEAAEITTEATLRKLFDLTADEVRTSEHWSEVLKDHAEVMQAMLALGKIVAKRESGARVKCGLWFEGPLSGLYITPSGFDKFGKVLGIGFEGAGRKDLRKDQKNNLLDIIGALHQLVTSPHRAQTLESDLAGKVKTIIKSRTGQVISDRTIRHYLAEAKERRISVPEGASIEG